MQPLGPTQEQQLPKIALHSPLALTGAFLYLLRQRFRPEFGTDWAWVDNKTDTGILIESQYEGNTEARDARPGIYVDKDQTSYGQVVLGDRDQSQPNILTRREEHFMSIAQTDMLIDCVSPARGESAQIGDIVQQYLHMSARVIMAVFSLRGMSPVVLGRTTPFQKQTDLFNTQLTFRIEYEVHWKTVPIAPVLRELGVFLQSQNDGVNTTLSKYYLKSLE